MDNRKNWTRGFYLTRTATSPDFIHLNEVDRARAMLLRQVRQG